MLSPSKIRIVKKIMKIRHTELNVCVRSLKLAFTFFVSIYYYCLLWKWKMIQTKWYEGINELRQSKAEKNTWQKSERCHMSTLKWLKLDRH